MNLNVETNYPNTNLSGDVSSDSKINNISSILPRRQIVIAGAGSIGTIMGLMFSIQGHHVTLVRKRGKFGELDIELVGVKNLHERIEVINSKIILNKNEKISPDIIVLAAQRQQLEEQLMDLHNIINFANKPIMMPIQNGLETPQVICEWMRINKLELPIIQAIIWWSATLQSSTQVLFHSEATTSIGIPQNLDCKIASQHEYKIVKDLLFGIFETKEVDIDRESYIKLILNVVSPVLAMVKQPYPTGINDLKIRYIIRKLFDEVIEIGKKEGWYDSDERIENFYQVLKGEQQLDHYSMHKQLPTHKVSSQISAEKYGGKGSNVSLLLTFFITHGAKLCERLMEVFLDLPPNYKAISSDQLLDLLQIEYVI